MRASSLASIPKSVTRDRLRYRFVTDGSAIDRFVDREDKERRVERSGLDQTFSKVMKEQEEGEEEVDSSRPYLGYNYR